jgi:hypothetical protein
VDKEPHSLSLVVLLLPRLTKASFCSARKQKNLTFVRFFYQSDPAGTRTQDPYIKSVLLYQLSYEIVRRNLRVQR